MLRQEYEMTSEQLDALVKDTDVIRSLPLIMLQCETFITLQKTANRAWETLGKELGFEYMTVKSSKRGQRFFTAEPKETKHVQSTTDPT